MVRLVFSTLLLLFCIMQYEAIAQDADSLENQVKGLKGKEKMEVLLKISNNTRNYAPQMSIDFGERYLTMAEELRDSAAMVEGLQNLGITYYNIGDFEKTIHCFLQALRIEEGRNHIKGVAQAYNNLGVVFEEIGQEEKALNYYQRSLTIKEELKDSVFMANTISNIGYIYLHMGEVREALQYFNQSLTLDKLLNNEEGIIKSLNNIGESYTALNKYDSALYFFNQALAKNEILSTYEKAQLYNNIANVYLNSQNYRKAIEIYQTALNLGKTVQAVVNIQDSYKGLSDAYLGLRAYERGLQCYKLYTAIKDSVLNEDSAIKIARIETDYRIQKREKEIELLKKEAEIRNLNLAKNRAVSYFLMGSLLLFLALVGILYHKYHFKQKANEMLEHQNREIANKNLNILDSILYAKGIQEAILPDTTVLDKVFKEAFIYCTPRD